MAENETNPATPDGMDGMSTTDLDLSLIKKMLEALPEKNRMVIGDFAAFMASQDGVYSGVSTTRFFDGVNGLFGRRDVPKSSDAIVLEKKLLKAHITRPSQRILKLLNTGSVDIDFVIEAVEEWRSDLRAKGGLLIMNRASALSLPNHPWIHISPRWDAMVPNSIGSHEMPVELINICR